MKIAAHRGASKIYLENSFSAIKKAIELGADIIEIDVRQTLDGRFVLMHDADCQKTANNAAFISDCTFSQIRSIRLRNGEQIPSLGEALSLVKGKAVLSIDFKDNHISPSLFRLIRRRRMVRQIIIGSELPHIITKTKTAVPRIKTALGGLKQLRSPEALVQQVINAGADIISPHYSIVSRSLVGTAHEAGLEVHTWTVNSLRIMKEMLAMGVDAITTDDLEKAMNLAVRNEASSNC